MIQQARNRKQCFANKYKPYNKTQSLKNEA